MTCMQAVYTDIINRGGTFLYTARCREIPYTGRAEETAQISVGEHGIDSVVVIGGDGSFQGCQRQLAANGNQYLSCTGNHRS